MIPAPTPRTDMTYADAIRIPEQVSPFMAFQVLKRRKILAVFIAFILLSVSLLVIFRLQPFYDASATILIETRRGAFSDLQASGEILNPDVIALRTQADILQSEELAANVVKSLDLVHEPVYERLLDKPLSLMSQAKAGVTTLLGIALHAPTVLTPDQRVQAVADILRGQVVVNNVGRSYVLEVKVRTSSPELSARIANALSAAYMAFNRHQKEDAIARGSGLLEAQIVPMRDRALTTEAAVERYRQENGLVLNNGGGGQVGQGTTLTGQQLFQSNSELTNATTDLAQKEASLASVESARRSGAGVYSLPEVLASPVVQKLREQEGNLLSREAVLNPVISESNPLTRSSNAEIAAIRRQIDAEVAKIVNGLRNQVLAARARASSLKQNVETLQSQLTGQNQAGIRLKQLENEAEAARTVYRALLGRYEQISNQIALQGADASVVSLAHPPLWRTGPPRYLYAAVAGLFSASISVLLTLVVERVSGGATIRTVGQLQVVTGLFPLGMLPAMSRRKRKFRQIAHRMASRRTLGVIRGAFRQIEKQGRAYVIMITSALPEEGKTWLAISLATDAQRAGERTLLIDADVRRPTMMRSMGLDDDEYSWKWRTNEALPYVMQLNVLPGLDVVSCRAKDHDQSKPFPLGWIAQLVRASASEYDLVVVDTPPLLLFSDAASLAPLTNGVVMAVRWQRTASAAVKAALHTLNICGANVIGGVLTRVRSEKLMTADPGSSAVYKDYARYLKRSLH